MEDHDDLFELIRRADDRFELDSDSCAALTVGLKIVNGVILANRNKEPFLSSGFHEDGHEHRQRRKCSKAKTPER